VSNMTYTNKSKRLRVSLAFLEDVEGLKPKEMGHVSFVIPLEDMEEEKDG